MREAYLKDHRKQEIDLPLAKKLRDPKGNLFAGRLLYMEGQRAYFEEPSFALDLEGYYCENKKYKALDILQKGDLVLIDKKQKIFWLLASTDEEDYVKKKELDCIYLWDLFLRQMRSFFYNKEFTEVSSPYLVDSPGIERHIDPFVTKWQSKEVYLPTSPEIHHKKLLVHGMRDIFEIKTCFRQEDLSPLHQPEFTMLEWYRAFANLDYIKEDLEQIFCQLFEREVKVKTHTIRDLFIKALDFPLSPNTTKEELGGLCQREQVSFTKEDDWSDLFHRLFIEKIEKELVEGQFYFLEKYPPQLAALAKLDSDGWADRLEVYWGPLEIANGYHELCDWQDYLKRFNEVNRLRKEDGKEPIPIDKDFIENLKKGMPPSAGIALGLERLFMVKENLNHIDEVVYFNHRL